MSTVAVTGLGRAEPEEFDVAARLPGRGYRRLPPACQYLLAATADALGDAGDPLAAVPAERRGAVVGTNNAGAALLDGQDRTILAGTADDLSPLTAPYFAMSLFVSRLSTERGIRGCNLTVNSPRTAGIEALQLGGWVLRRGRAEVLVAGATEDAVPDHPDSDRGAVVLICTAPEGAAGAYGTCRVRTAFVVPGSAPADTVGAAWTAVAGDLTEPTVDAVLDDSPVGAVVGAWLAARAPTVAVTRAGPGCLAPLRRVADLLAAGGPDRVVVTAAAEGNIAFARLTPTRRPS